MSYCFQNELTKVKTGAVRTSIFLSSIEVSASLLLAGESSDPPQTLVSQGRGPALLEGVVLEGGWGEL